MAHLTLSHTILNQVLTQLLPWHLIHQLLKHKSSTPQANLFSPTPSPELRPRWETALSSSIAKIHLWDQTLAIWPKAILTCKTKSPSSSEQEGKKVRGKTGMGVGEESPVLSDLIGNFVVAKRKKKISLASWETAYGCSCIGRVCSGFLNLLFSLSPPLFLPFSCFKRGLWSALINKCFLLWSVE